MHPLRILILGFLLYLVFRLLTGGKKPVEKVSNSVPKPHDVLVEDPICKVCIPKKQAIVFNDEGKDTYFCSQECCEQFIATKGDQQ